jgi:flagellar basal-body rod modification protein FlgD
MAGTTQAVSALPLIGRNVEYDGASAALTADGRARFSYTLPSQAATSVVTITDSQGRVVWRASGETGAGRHDFTWDGHGLDGSALPPGTYTFAVAASRADKSAITATTTAIGKVDGIELQGGQPLMSIGALKIPTTKMLAIKDTN